MKPIFAITFLVFLFQGCNDARKPVSDMRTPETAFSVQENVDANFETFLAAFSKDSVFQMDRVSFPLTVDEMDDNFEPVRTTVTREQYRRLDFSAVDASGKNDADGYTQKTTTDGGKRIIEIRGIENGISVDYVFQKIDGKWKLLTWTDQST
jgi:hypothetical protein